MNKSQLIEELSKRVGNDKEEIRYILEELNNIILEKTRAGEKVCIQGFGVYTPRLQTSRLARNPKSGETLMLIPRTIVHFKCAPNLLKEINNKKVKGRLHRESDLFVIPLMTYQRQHSYNLHQYLSSIFHASAYLFHGVRPRLDIIFQFYIAIDRPFSLVLINKSTSFQRHLPPLSHTLIVFGWSPVVGPVLSFQVDTIDPIMILS